MNIEFKQTLKIKKQFKCSYKDCWNEIKRKSNFTQPNYYNKDQYFEEVPSNQHLLTDFDNICTNKIIFSNFNQIDIDQINTKNIYDCFHGILNYIFYYSGNKFNIEEIEVHYSGSKSRQNLEKMNGKYLNNQVSLHDIMNIFDYENIHSQFEINCVMNAFFGITFKRIRINPVAYSIRSGSFYNFNSHLISFTFEGYDEDKKRWEVLDEQNNINDLIPEGSYRMFFVRTTNQSYSLFKIKQTSPGSNDFWGFCISSFDIHGIISYKEEIWREINLFENHNYAKINNTNEESFFLPYNPMIDMTECIL